MDMDILKHNRRTKHELILYYDYEFMASEKQKVVCFKLFMWVMMLFKACRKYWSFPEQNISFQILLYIMMQYDNELVIRY